MTAYISYSLNTIGSSIVSSSKRRDNTPTTRATAKYGHASELPVAIIKISFLINKESAPINNIIKLRCIKCDLFNQDTTNVMSQIVTTKTIVPKCSSSVDMVVVSYVKYYQVSVYNKRKFVALAHK